jgi:uncharacterized protein YgiM (DUF1202 family)
MYRGTGRTFAWLCVGLFSISTVGQSAERPSGFATSSAVETLQTQQKYVAATSLNCRSDASSTASVVKSLKKNETVEVTEELGDWSRLVEPECWVVSRYLADMQAGTGEAAGLGSAGETSSTSSAKASVRNSSVNFYAENGTSKKQRVRRAKPASKSTTASSSRRTRRSSRSEGIYSGSTNCPCSGGNVCIGPRGGRYCITRGGNKRYGV